jgi:cytochrome c-type biogenesis protein CcsB
VNELILPALWLGLAATLMASVALWTTAFADARPGGAGTQPGRSGWAALSAAARLGAAALLLFAVVLRWRATDQPPWTNMWEFTVAFAASIAVFSLGFGARLRGVPMVGSLVHGVIALLLLAALLLFPPRIDPLVPALRSKGILGLHVGFMVAAYGALALSFCAGILRLVQGDARRFAVLPAAVHLDGVAHASVVLGFPLLTVGVLLGAYWANDAWGRYWAWDPKETSSLITWLIYGAYLHVRGIGGWSGRRAALLLVAGYLAVLFTYFGVNFWISGLHSYA